MRPPSAMKRKMKAIVKTLNAEGFTGGFYTYKRKECSCCYGLKDVDFEVNANIPMNWGLYGNKWRFHYKICYEGPKMEAFRQRCNALILEQFPSEASIAEDTSEAILVEYDARKQAKELRNVLARAEGKR